MTGDSPALLFAALAAAAYLLGSINWAVLLMRLSGRPDPRTTGSGNAGTTNVYRLAGPFWAAAVLVLDLGRAVGLALAGERLLPRALLPWLALALLLGNRYPLFHGLRGGKGVAAFLGYVAPLSPWAAAGSAVAWLAGWGVTRRPFLASFLMVAVLAAGLGWTCDGWRGWAGVAVCVAFIVWGHRRNLRD